MEKARTSCFTCVYFRQYEDKPYTYFDRYGIRRSIEAEIVSQCTKTLKAIRTIRNDCTKYISVSQAKLNIEGGGMVKINDIPKQKPRYDLKNLPETVELIAISETMVEGGTGKREVRGLWKLRTGMHRTVHRPVYLQRRAGYGT